MAGATIDHMISLTILIAALLIAMMSFNQLFSTAVAYETNTQVATKAVDIMNTLCLSPGNPVDWGSTNDTVLGFGLQDPQVGGYALSPYSIMRLNTASDGNPLVYYSKTGVYYNNISTNDGYAILTPIGECINYTTAAELLGLDGKYGFSVVLTPTLNVTVSDASDGTIPHHLKVNVKIQGSGLPLTGAALHYYLFYVNKTDDSEFPQVIPYSNITQTNSSGEVDIDFYDLTDNNPVYSFVVYVSLGGLNGVGSYTCNDGVAENTFIIPLVEDYDEGKLILAHSWDVVGSGDEAAVHYNASFYSLTSDFNLQPFELPNSTALINSGTGKPYNTTQIPASQVGLLVISYTARGDFGCIIMPWGIGALGVSASFAGDFGSGGSSFVATEVRQVTIDDISYQVKVSAWKLGN